MLWRTLTSRCTVCIIAKDFLNLWVISWTLPINCPQSKFSWSFVIHVIFSLLCEACYEKPWLHLPTSGTPPTYKLNPPPSLLSLKNIHFIIWEIQFEKREIWFKLIHLPTSRIPVTYSYSSFFMWLVSYPSLYTIFLWLKFISSDSWILLSNTWN